MKAATETVPAAAALSEAELCSAVTLLQSLIPADEMPAYDLQRSPATVYTTLVTLWLIVLQRLQGGVSLVQAVKDLQTRHRHLLPDNKRVREDTLSENSSTFSRARSRLPLETVRAFATQVSTALIDRAPPWFAGRRAFLIDGTTVTLAPTPELQRAYPPATNQHGVSVWPVLLLLVAHELQSGVALLPELGAMYGVGNTSEAAQAVALAQRLPPESLVLADANFGIFSVAWAMRTAGHHLLFRVSKSRFKALRRQATPVTTVAAAGTCRTEPGPWRLCWQPSVKDRQHHPDLPAEAAVEVVLHESLLPNGKSLYLVTTLTLKTEQAGELYRRRYDVEFDLRDWKVVLGLETLHAKSAAMMEKELLCGLVAYNLVQNLRREAAEQAGVAPRRLSFTGVWTTLQTHLLYQTPCSYAQWLARYEKALVSAAKAKLPNRPNRQYPRRAHPRRPKSTEEQRAKKPAQLKITPSAIPK